MVAKAEVELRGKIAATGLAIALALQALPSDAQRMWGRRGFSWQPEIQLAQEEMARLEADLDRLSLAEWRERSLAWLVVEPRGDLRFDVTSSWRVENLVFRRRAEIRPLAGSGVSAANSESPSAPEPAAPADAWRVEFVAKPQTRVGVVMTDRDNTRVVCPLVRVLGEGGALGVFQHDGILVCMPRAPEPDR